MSRPLTKTQLLETIEEQYTALEKFLAPLTAEQMAFAPAPGAWAVKDILAHLYEWQQMFFNWYESGQRGENPAVPAPGYKWNQLPALNQAIYEKYQDLTPDEALSMFRESHQKTVQFTESLPEADLTAPGLYKWMNQNTLMAYLNANTAAHYLWALKDAKKALNGAGTPKSPDFRTLEMPIETRPALLARLNETAIQLTDFYRSLPNPAIMVYELWTAKDVLAHLTFWHESFARNVDDLAHNQPPSPLKGRLADLNQAGVEALALLSLAEVLERFEKAHAIIQAHILNPALALIPYRKGSREYTAEEHLELVNDHINHHLRDIRKALKR